MGKIYLGTSGWSYKDWVGPFYPQGLASARWFAHYCAHFRSVELNVTFYRNPTPKAVETWRESSPRDFQFAIKMNRQITHILRLEKAEGALDRFLEMARGFKTKLGVILIQLPPSLAFEAGKVGKFLTLLRKKDSARRYALEFRHPSWFEEKALRMLSEKNIACCIADSGGRFPETEAITAPFVYVRFHGPAELYGSKYNDKELAAAAEKIQGWNQGRDVYVYFNNDRHGFGIENAFKLREMLSRRLVDQAA